MKTLVALVALSAILFVGVPVFADEPGQEGLKLDEGAGAAYMPTAHALRAPVSATWQNIDEDIERVRVEARD